MERVGGAAPARLAVVPAAAGPVRPAQGGGAGAAVHLPVAADPATKRLLPLFFAMVAVVGFRLHEMIPVVNKIRPALLLTLLSAAVIMAVVPKERLRTLTQDRVSRLVLCYLGWAFLSIPTSLWKGASVDAFTGFAFPAVVIFALVASMKPSAKTLDVMHVGYVACTILLVVETVVLGRFAFGRLSMFGSLDSNDLASVAALGFPLAVSLVVRRRGLVRVLGIIGVVTLLAGLGKFNSRGGTVAFAAGATVLMLLQPGARKLQLMVLMLVAGAAFWATAPDEYRQRIIGLNNLETDYNYTSYWGRKAIWGRARGYMLHNPVFGVGMGAFPVAEGQSIKDSGMTGKWSATHNAYLQAGAEIGVPGMLFYIATLVAAGLSAWHLSRRRPQRPDLPVRPEFLASLVGFATGAYFLSHAYFFPLFALLAFCSYAKRVWDAENASGQRAGDIGRPPHANSVRPLART